MEAVGSISGGKKEKGKVKLLTAQEGTKQELKVMTDKRRKR
jgi:hypothetical protein